MQGFKKSPFRGLSRHTSADTRHPVNTPSNPFDSDDELDNRKTFKISGRTSSEPSLFTSSTNPFEDEEIKGCSSPQRNLSSASKNRFKNDFRDTLSTNPFEDEEIKDSFPQRNISSATKNRFKNRDASSTNPFEDEEIKSSSSAERNLASATENRFKNRDALSTNPFEDEEIKGRSSPQRNLFSATKNRFKNRDAPSTNCFEDEEIIGSSSPQRNLSSATKNRFKSRDALSTNRFEDKEIKGSSSPQRNLSSATKNRFKNDIRDTSSTKPFEDEEIKGRSSSHLSSAAKNRYMNDFRDSGGLKNQSVEELENYATYRAEETTKTVNNCLKIAEDIREDATKTLVTLHQQGEQISRTHMVAADMDHDLSRGEKLLGSLGGIFSKTWKPKKTRTIRGPVVIRDDPVQRRGNHLEQREKLGLTSASKQRSVTPTLEPTNAMQKVEVEKVKQDDALLDLSNILGELKGMAIDMGSEIDRQNKAINYVQDDVDELNFRVKGANQRTRRLLGK